MPTYRLETFGKLALSGGASGLSHQRRRLALLALLAASGERGMSRDQLLGYLWPESSSANARHSLEQLIHSLRRSLGESVFTGVNPVALNSEVVGSDVTEFERALARGALADAVALHAGPFLEGFYLDEAPEFERWTTTERSRLGDRYAEALNRLAVDAEKAGDHAGAVGWRRRLAEADPLSSRNALALMRALVAAGDKTSALKHARVYEALVQQELDSAADPSIAKYAATLRAGVDEPVTVKAPTPAVEPKESVSPPAATSAPTDLQVVDKPHVEKLTTEKPTGTRWSYGRIAAVFVGAAILVIVAWSVINREKVPPLDQNKIVVVPFRTSGADSSVKYLGEGIVDLIAPMLTGEGGPIAVDSRTAISTWNRVTQGAEGTADDARNVARALGAGLVLSGAVVETGGKLTITGNVISGQTGDTRPLTSVSAPIDSLDALLDRFVAQLLTRQSGVAETSVAAITSQSLPAIRAYLDGRAAYRRADQRRAIESFTRAIDIDSTFALAALDLTVATGKLLRSTVCQLSACRVFSVAPGFVMSDREDDLFNRGVRLAWAYRAKLGTRDRPLLDALRGNNYPRESPARETLVNLDRAVAAAPDRPESHYLLGVLLLYQGRALGPPDSRGRAEAELREASRLDSTYLAPLARLVDVAAFARDVPALRSAGISYLLRDSTGPTADYVRWITATATGDLQRQRTMRARLRSLGSSTLEQIYFTSQMSGLGLEDADSAAMINIENATTSFDKSVAFRRAHLLTLSRGRPAAATEWLRRAVEQRSQPYTFRQFAIGAALFSDGDRVVGDSAARDLERSLARDTVGVLSQNAVAQISVALATESWWYLDRGDTVKAAAASDWLRRHTEGQPRNRILSILAEMIRDSRARKPNGARLRTLVDSVSRTGCCVLSSAAILMLARAYEESGDDASALQVFRRGVWYFPPRELTTFLREEGRLAAKLGDRTGAIRAYEHYLALRSDPEPVLRQQRDNIRAEVARLKRSR